MQIGGITGTGTNAYFVYQLDNSINTFSALSALYGTTIDLIQRANPTLNSSRLRIDQRVNVPAKFPPAQSMPSGTFPEGRIINSTPVSVRFRWNTNENSNLIGRINRGTIVKIAPSGIIVNLTDIINKCQGILNELQRRTLATSAEVYGFVDSANLIRTDITQQDIMLLAQMIYSEQRSLGHDAMVAAAFVAYNRFRDGWGTFSQILNPVQFQGMGQPFNASGLNQIDARMWQDAQQIARQVTSNAIIDNGHSLYFGNGEQIRAQMERCHQLNSGFAYTTVPAALDRNNLYLSEGNYLDCSM